MSLTDLERIADEMEKCVQGHGPISVGANDPIDADAWVEATPEEMLAWAARLRAWIANERGRLLDDTDIKAIEDAIHDLGVYEYARRDRQYGADLQLIVDRAREERRGKET